MWMINTDYDQEFFFCRNGYFLGVDPSAWLSQGRLAAPRTGCFRRSPPRRTPAR